MFTSRLEYLQKQRADALDAIALADLLEKLKTNRAFKQVIEDGFMKQYALDQTAMLARPEMRGNPQKQDILKENLVAVSVFGDYLNSVFATANMAAGSLAEIESEIDLEMSEDEDEDEV